ncbi:retrotransposon gag family protein, partial [Enterobacter cloacae]|uniref:retrotransposon gag family protein n=1 Tax=Enterobacter cloacae TaxID=550 RepID=UPI0023E3FDE2
IENLIYEIKHATIQMLPTFYSLERENPYDHLHEFLGICSTIRIQGFLPESLKLFLFPFSLKDKAKHWISTLQPVTPITTWEHLQRLFLSRFYSVGKTHQMRRGITNFVQHEQEPFDEAWERMKELLRLCPHHGVPKWQIVESFVRGLTEGDKQNVKSACGGAILSKREDE